MLLCWRALFCSLVASLAPRVDARSSRDKGSGGGGADDLLSGLEGLSAAFGGGAGGGSKRGKGGDENPLGAFGDMAAAFGGSEGKGGGAGSSGGGGDLGSLLGGLFGGGDSGKSTCDDGRTPVPMPNNHKAMTANGCGPQGMQIPEEFGLFRCCNFHDVCFATCGTTHKWCEEEFKGCLKRVCKAQPKDQRKKCKETSESFSGLTDMFGNGFHASSQKDSCSCEKKGAPAAKGHQTYLKAFLQEYEPEEATDEKVEKALKKWEGKEGELYASLVKKYGHKFITFDNIGAEFEAGRPVIELDEL